MGARGTVTTAASSFMLAALWVWVWLEVFGMARPLPPPRSATAGTLPAVPPRTRGKFSVRFTYVGGQGDAEDAAAEVAVLDRLDAVDTVATTDIYQAFLEEPKHDLDSRSRMCSRADMASDRHMKALRYMKHSLSLYDVVQSRHLWQATSLVVELEKLAMLVPSGKGVAPSRGYVVIGGGDVAPAPLVSYLVSKHIELSVTDTTTGRAGSSTKEYLWDMRVLPTGREDVLAKVQLFAPDAGLLNSVPKAVQFAQHDWIASMGHLSGKRRRYDANTALAYITESLTSIKPGGLAIHFTDCVLNSHRDHIAREGTFFTPKTYNAWAGALRSAGHAVAELEFHAGPETDVYAEGHANPISNPSGGLRRNVIGRDGELLIVTSHMLLIRRKGGKERPNPFRRL